MDLVVARPGQQGSIELPGFRRDQRLILNTIEVLGTGCFGCEKRAERRAVLYGWLLPILLNRVPTLAETLLIGVAVLRNDV